MDVFQIIHLGIKNFIKQNGRKPNNTELRELAESHVRNGYQENGVDIPSGVHRLLKRLTSKLDEQRH